MHARSHKVVAVAFDRLSFFEFGIAVEVFGLSRPQIKPWYEFSVCRAETGPIEMTAGISMNISKGLRSLVSADTIIIPSWRDVNEPPPQPLMRALQKANARGARIVSLCSGAFVLAAAGLLDGRRATTHWRYADQLASAYPDVEVDPNVLYIDDENILTAAGSAAGIDLCLHIVRRDFGAELANRVAKRLVVPPYRDGGQAQFIDRPVTECKDTGLAKLLDQLLSELKGEHTVESMAKRVHMSPRTFARRFKDQTGTTPAKWLSRERVKCAQRLLETTGLAIDRLAAECGFGSAQLLRFHFQRVMGRTPTAYRRTFRQSESR